MKLTYTVPEKYDNTAVKVFLRGHCCLSYRLMVSLKHVENGIMNNGVHTRVIDKVRTGDVITLDLPDKPPKAEAMSDLYMPGIIYEDEHITVIDKPAHMPVHTSKGHYSDTLANAVAAYDLSLGRQRAFRPVYRLDADTSGVVVLANHAHAAARLAGRVEKQYYAVVEGEIDPPAGTIDLPLGKCEGYGIKRLVDENGENAVTHYHTLLSSAGRSLLSIRLETGRTHQIRAHFAHLGHPVTGDWMYGLEAGFDRFLLHCGFAWLEHPATGEMMCFRSKLPDLFFETLYGEGSAHCCISGESNKTV
ncbi:MAG: RluA family pseudouridine synthase [Clostridia bacterium]|nr:RluA family pseudouridine synthase [Clostridia bacterium]